MSKKSLLLLLLLISWTVLFGQTRAWSQGSKDTIKCYTPAELRAIAFKLISGAECDTLLKIANVISKEKDTTIASQARTIIKQDIRQITTEHLVDECQLTKRALQKDLKKARRHLLWTKVGWAGTTVILSITTVLALIN